jgi:hypothetical protein
VTSRKMITPSNEEVPSNPPNVAGRARSRLKPQDPSPGPIRLAATSELPRQGM